MPNIAVSFWAARLTIAYIFYNTKELWNHLPCFLPPPSSNPLLGKSPSWASKWRILGAFVDFNVSHHFVIKKSKFSLVKRGNKVESGIFLLIFEDDVSSTSLQKKGGGVPWISLHVGLSSEVFFIFIIIFLLKRKKNSATVQRVCCLRLYLPVERPLCLNLIRNLLSDL